MSSVLGYAAFAFFPLVVAYAAASDLLTMTIPNRVSLALVAGFVLLVGFAGVDLATIGLHLAAGAIVLMLGFACFSFGWVGGGDAKLAAAAALWLGLPQLLPFMLQTAFYGGSLTIMILAVRAKVPPALAARQAWLFRLHDPATGVPYGIAITAAALVVYPHTAWMSLVVG